MLTPIYDPQGSTLMELCDKLSFVNPIQQKILEFYKSDLEAAEIDVKKYVSPESCRNSWRQSVRSLGLQDRLRVRTHQGKALLIRIPTKETNTDI